MVENNNYIDDLAAEASDVADHEKAISFLDRAGDGLMTSTKLFKVASELTSITDTLAELFTQLVELIVEEIHH